MHIYDYFVYIRILPTKCNSIMQEPHMQQVPIEGEVCISLGKTFQTYLRPSVDSVPMKWS